MMDNEKGHAQLGTRRVNLIIITLFLLPLSWLGVYWVELQVFLNLSCNEVETAVTQDDTVTSSLRKQPNNNVASQFQNNDKVEKTNSVVVTNNNNNESFGKFAQKRTYNRQNDNSEFKNQYGHKFLYNNGDDKSQRPRSMLCLYEGDEGSTVMTEALRLHPHVYSPEWRVEPANYRLWPQEEFTLQKQLDAIRFLLMLPSNTTNFQVKLDEPISLEDYKSRSADAEAIYIKVNVCRTIRKNRKKYNDCVAEAFSLLTCGTDHDTVDDLILPLRYGFDRICSLYIHSDRKIYKHYSQFGGGEKTWEPAPADHMSITEEIAMDYVERQQNYITNFMENMRLAGEVCPNQKHRSKVHIFDYDHAKKVGMEDGLKSLFGDLDLSHDQKHVDLGDFGGRKPGNYCGRIFDEKSKAIWREAQTDYNKWLKSFCTSDDVEQYPWCTSGIPVVEI